MPSREWFRNYAKNYYAKKKRFLIDSLGGACVACGSTKNLHFDHVVPSCKSFSITTFLDRPWADTLEELKKCQLLCSSCHHLKTLKEGSYSKRNNHGSSVGTAVLTEDQVRIICSLIKEGKKIPSISKRFGVHKATIYAIKNGVTWVRVTGGAF